MLGPKFPDIRFYDEGDSVRTEADGYVPLGGFTRASFSVELRLPVPPLGPRMAAHLFLDGGRVWTGDSRFATGDDSFDQQRFFYATGAGLDLATPVGAIRLSVGYKLNPSLLDLVDSDDLLRALDDGTDTAGLERHDSRRWQVHIAIGSSY
jgi:outer membrane protein assembly factor BamA